MGSAHRIEWLSNYWLESPCYRKVKDFTRSPKTEIHTYIENEVGAGISPRLTPLSMAIGSDKDTLKLCRPFISLCNCLGILTKPGQHPILRRIIQRVYLFMELQALIKSTKTRYNATRCSKYLSCSRRPENIISFLTIPGLNPHWVRDDSSDNPSCRISAKKISTASNRLFRLLINKEIMIAWIQSWGRNPPDQT